MNKPNKQDVWHGEHLGFQYRIVHWNQGQRFTPGNDGIWNYYIYFRESKIKDFDSLWLEDKVQKFRPESEGWISHDYYDTAVSNVKWHGGVTYYAKHGELKGYRCVEFGCDYSHSWDHDRGCGFTLEEVLQDVELTINELQPLLKYIPCKHSYHILTSLSLPPV